MLNKGILIILNLQNILLQNRKIFKKDERWKLKVTPIWPKENLVRCTVDPDQKIQHFVAKDLHAPLVLFHKFGLPILD